MKMLYSAAENIPVKMLYGKVYILNPKSYFSFGIILEKQLTPVAKVGFFNILYH